MSSPARQRKRLTAEARRAAILDAAQARLLGRGYHAPRSTTSPREAGVSKALIYEHFASKQELHADLSSATPRELFERLGRGGAERGRAARRGSRPASTPSSASSRSAATPGGCCSARPPTPRRPRVLDRMLAQVTAVVAALIAAEPGAQSLGDESGERRSGIQLIAQMLVGAAQSLANWWADHQEVPREQHRGDRRWTSPGSGSTGSAAASAGRAGRELRARRGRRRRPGAAGPGGARRATASAARSPSARWPTAPRGWPARSRARGVGRGDVVMTLVGNRPEWVYAMVACWRLGAVAQPCTEQLRARDLRARMDAGRARAPWWPTSATLDAAWPPPASTGRVLIVPDERLFDAEPAAGGATSTPSDPALIVFTSGTAGEPKPIRHGHGYLAGQRVQAEHWFGARPGRPLLVHGGERLVEVGAQRVRGRLAARRRGAAPRRPLRPRRAARRCSSASGVDVLCMAPTEYRAIAKRAELRPLPGLRHAVAAGEPLNPEVVRAWQEGAGRGGPRRLRPDRDRRAHRHADRPAGAARARWARPLPGFRALDRRGRAVRGPGHRAHLLPRRAARPALAHRRPRARGRGRLPLVRGPHRRRDHLRRLPDRAVRGGVGARLPPGGGGGRGRGGARRGARPGGARGGGAARRLTSRATSWPASSRSTSSADRALQVPAHRRVRRQLPKTPSGKIKRAELRRVRPAGRSPAVYPRAVCHAVRRTCDPSSERSDAAR